jgi:hypothetical protein
MQLEWIEDAAPALTQVKGSADPATARPGIFTTTPGAMGSTRDATGGAWLSLVERLLWDWPLLASTSFAKLGEDHSM